MDSIVKNKKLLCTDGAGRKERNLNVCIQKKSVLSMIPYPERGRTFRATLEFDTEEAAKKAFESMVSGVGTFVNSPDDSKAQTITENVKIYSNKLSYVVESAVIMWYIYLYSIHLLHS